MRRTAQTLALWSLVLLGLWGCSQGPNQRTALVDRIKALEAKNQRLDQDLRAATAARDQLKQQLVKFDELGRLLQDAARERDELKVQVKVRTAERDQAAGQFDAFRRSLRDVLGQADAAAMKFADAPAVSVSLKAAE